MKGSTLKNISDEEVIYASTEDIQAFEEIIRRYEKPLLRYIMRISSFSEEESEEILQEVFIKAWKNLNDFDRSQKFSSWIYRITHNETISTFRKEKSRGYEQKVDWDEEIMSNIPDKINIIKDVDQKITAENIQRALSMMDEKYRSILVLRFLEEKSYEEISDILRIPPGTAATLLSRAKKELSRIYKSHFVETQ
jgi:RNA polymerase sigma-70 factor (ECF subfamily)